MIRRPVPRCPICGAEHATCGPATTVAPVDQLRPASEKGMPLKRYTLNDGTTLKLNDEDARRLGLLGKAQPNPEPAPVTSEQLRPPRSRKRPAPGGGAAPKGK